MSEKEQSTAKLLLVDDEPIILNTLANGLNKLGYIVTTSESAENALELYRNSIPDLVVVDYNMPKMNGLQLAKQMIEYEHRPIIMLSAYNDLPLVREAIGVGITTYLVKPVDAEHMAPSIEAALARFTEITAIMEQGANIQAGIETQRLISTAVGIVMSQTNRPQDLAFESLRRLARDQRRPLRDVAFDLVDSVSSANSVLLGLRSVK